MADPSQAVRLRRAHSLLMRGDRAGAEVLYRELLQGGVADSALLCNLAVICWQKDQLGEMEQLLRRALSLSPDHADAHYNLALALTARGASHDAIHHYRQALPLASSQIRGSIHWNLSKLLLRQGEYSEGWEHYEWRRHKAQPLPPICQPGMPVWNGEETPEELVLVGEQGLGDMIQFLRYAPVLAGRFPRISLGLPDKLHDLVRCSGLGAALRSPAEVSAQRHGRWLPLLSVPRLLRVCPEAVQVPSPYLAVPAERVQHWYQQLRRALDPGVRVVGLNWQGNPATETSELRGRSLPLQALAPLVCIAGMRFVSLQKGPGSEQLAGSAIAGRLVACQAEVDAAWDFVDTAAITMACDLVITSDSVLAHLAGALGAPAWLLLHHSSDWRWGETGDTTFWYQSLRLFRQQSPGDWASVLERVHEALALDSPTRLAPPEELERQALQLLQQSRPADAEPIYRQLLNRGHANAAVLGNLAAICGASGRHAEALELLDQTLRMDPGNAAALSNLLLLADTHLARAEWQQAEALLDRVLACSPSHPMALDRLRKVMGQLGRHEQAVSLARRVAELLPEAAEAHFNLGVALKRAGSLDEARQSYERALELNPEHPEAQSNLSMILLLQGDYRRGLPLREARFRKRNPVTPVARMDRPAWPLHTPLARTEPLLIVGEQGLGDMMQFIRYVTVLRERQADVWLCLPEALVELAQVSGVARRVLSPAELQDCSASQRAHWLPLLSVPLLLGVTPADPIITDPYLQSTPSRRRRWRQMIAEAALTAGQDRPQPVVALHWQGNLETANLEGRSFPLETLAPLAQLMGFCFLSLQKGYGSEQLESCSFRHRFLSCQEAVAACWDFVDTAAMLLACDLVITSDSALAHLAGGLGIPTWLLLQRIPDWRWGLEGESTFWYPSMRLFRQPRPGDWTAVINTVRHELQSWLRDRGASKGRAHLMVDSAGRARD